MQQIALTDTYQKITPSGTGTAVIQGYNCTAFLGTSPPGANDPGIYLKDNWPIPIDLDKFNEIWVKGTGLVRFAG